MMADEDLRQLLEAHKPHFTLTPEGKVKCELNGHMLPARAEAVAAFAKCAAARPPPPPACPPHAPALPWPAQALLIEHRILACGLQWQEVPQASGEG